VNFYDSASVAIPVFLQKIDSNRLVKKLFIQLKRLLRPKNINNCEAIYIWLILHRWFLHPLCPRFFCSLLRDADKRLLKLLIMCFALFIYVSDRLHLNRLASQVHALLWQRCYATLLVAMANNFSSADAT